MEFKLCEKQDHTEIEAKNSAGLVLTLTDLGAAIREIKVPDRRGESRTVTLCPLNDELYRNAYHGKTIGRSSGRIAGATFSIDGRTAQLERNNFGADNLHGGSHGLHAAVFGYEIKRGKEYSDVVFKYTSPDGEGGYFGTVEIVVTYRIRENQNTFTIVFDGTSDIKTLLNLTNHVYLNMGGDLEESVNEQILYINAPEYGKLNNRLIIEKILPVNEEMDFRTPHKIGDYIYRDTVQKDTKGYDHPYFLSSHGFDDVVASLYSERSGIGLEIRTTYPCVVFYADGQADERVEVFPGKYDRQYLAACLECQYHPDGVHQAPRNCGLVWPGKPYHEQTEYRFTISER